MEKNDNPEWGLRYDLMPRFTARLVQEGNRLHYLADRAGITGTFNEEECHQLNAAFPHFIKQMELMLLSGELNSRDAHRVTLYHNELTCEADTLGSCGYVYIAIYPTQR
ncbi:type IV toxin-antitoxin system YeeU family antitoxin [Photorhabdus laumondii subsp. laumondii]|uniref:Photorhabdus luminescens subsp. laumondii TTO1 complete genome segment 1/17 n=2 Tax=Photorhabdus laumondii subsp. laumondii TaxID=141679 RepID=Q7NA13_PHOLL|nr:MULTISPECIES: type IV toxin-antitoxin system YeeU family antitoxin [Photorhabdus]AXG45490.1 type IV toxin-antitoxin system YeeU family antitoxin [Photorhabdus laumondii subsp. laumondii]KTL60239.1 antitoxin [Photorhabdus laumondii subsp. laumondii]MCC8384852.1 type IV toxin-antitoxin system YeeU family antitoxin [Photorhabdus laumondii]MCC8414211.1 type IV toxin-antitoxin system YeeU family antitoxin [Photorhabdus laumondii]NDK95600.1 type IV toxin-antitoxin system YeeU family antitoxin [Ph